MCVHLGLAVNETHLGPAAIRVAKDLIFHKDYAGNRRGAVGISLLSFSDQISIDSLCDCFVFFLLHDSLSMTRFSSTETGQMRGHIAVAA